MLQLSVESYIHFIIKMIIMGVKESNLFICFKLCVSLKSYLEYFEGCLQDFKVSHIHCYYFRQSQPIHALSYLCSAALFVSS